MMSVSLKDLMNEMRGAIFDIDGTMVDSMQLHLEVWYEIARKYGSKLSLKEVGEKAYGINPEIMERIFPGKYNDAQKDEIANEKEELFRQRFDPEKHVIKGFIHFLDALYLKGIPMVIGSAAPPENIRFFMNALGIGHYFKGEVHEDMVVEGKPNPDVFVKAAALIGIPTQDCIVFEDSTSGAEAAHHAGSKIIIVLSTKKKSDFDGIGGIIGFVDDFTELMD